MKIYIYIKYTIQEENQCDERRFAESPRDIISLSLSFSVSVFCSSSHLICICTFWMWSCVRMNIIIIIFLFVSLLLLSMLVWVCVTKAEKSIIAHIIQSKLRRQATISTKILWRHRKHDKGWRQRSCTITIRHNHNHGNHDNHNVCGIYSSNTAELFWFSAIS